MQKAFSKILDVDLSSGTLNEDWWIFAVNENSVKIVNDPLLANEKAIKFHININENFGGLAVNGLPRAAIKYIKEPLYTIGNEYIIKFKTFLPLDFQYETRYSNEFVFYDMHTTNASGSSPNSVGIDKDKYLFYGHIDVNYNPPTHIANIIQIDNIGQDLGRWVEWVNYYKPSFSPYGRSIVWKDNKKIFDFKGYTSYKIDDSSYQQFQIYKYYWKTQPSDTTDEILYLKNIKVFQRKLK